MKLSTEVADLVCAAYKTATDGGKIHVFAGAAPADAETALDMATVHTELVVFTLDGDGTTGLTWASPSGGVLVKDSGDEWSGVINFVGAQAASAGVTALTPTFARFCEPGDNGRGAGGSSKRLQFTVSGPTGSGELVLGGDTVFDNGTNEESANFARIIPNRG